MNANRGANSKNRARKFQPVNSRGVAFVVLNGYREAGEFVAPAIDRASTTAKLSTQDRGLANELVNGIVRRQATLDAIIAPRVSRPRDRVEPELWTLLRLGTYQLLLLSSIPAHAAVNETVELAARYGKRQWTGLLNGVLRAIDRSIGDETVGERAADVVPLAGGLFRKLTEQIFPDPATDFSAYISTAFSYPRWLIDRWSERYEPDEIERLAFWFNAPGTPCLRVNHLKSDRQQVLDELQEAGIAASEGRLPETIRLAGRVSFSALRGATGGHYTLQDESAMLAVDLLNPQPGETVLDLCAAPGTKTTHIAERMQNSGRIVATDIQPDRLSRVVENCTRLGISIVEPQLIDREGKKIPDGPFDAILIDVPCTNTGVLGKRPEVRWRLSLRDFQELPNQQRQLLNSAACRLKPTGRLVYSTCSIEAAENRDVVAKFIEQNPDFRLAEERIHIPGQPADGGYQALIRRT